ncbi:MAG: carbamate kinase [Nitrososphaerales archaeon]|nr:carbamate kinase [Nitrososphaerales archaeon]
MKILVAVGGNAILRRGQTGTAGEQLTTIDQTCRQLVKIIKAGHDVAITHGNGPQVGDILLAYDSAKRVPPPMPLDVCGAQSQGMIGYMLQQSLENELRLSGLGKRVATVLTQTVVSATDKAFAKPTKPIGQFYGRTEAKELESRNGWTMVDERGKGFRRVVPSPDPVSFLEGATIKSLFEAGTIVIAAGGGGVPVIHDATSGGYVGVEAVIDKDLGAALLAKLLGVDLLMLLTDVEGVFLNYGRPGQTLVHEMSAGEARRHLGEGQFPSGSMGPKVEAALRFIESGGKRAVISALERVESALKGEASTSFRLN